MRSELLSFEILDCPPCLQVLENGAVRIGSSRVPLERIVYHYNQGVGAEEFVEMFPAVGLADAHGALCYYLNHREQVDAYAAWVEEEGERIRALIEALPGHAERVRLMDEEMERYRQTHPDWELV